MWEATSYHRADRAFSKIGVYLLSDLDASIKLSTNFLRTNFRQGEKVTTKK